MEMDTFGSPGACSIELPGCIDWGSNWTGDPDLLQRKIKKEETRDLERNSFIKNGEKPHINGAVTDQITIGRKFDQDKPDWSLLPISLLEDTVKVLTFGAKKYERNNWQKVDNASHRYYAALMRHLMAWQSGESHDPESGLSHLAHAMCCLTFLTYFEKQKLD